MRFKKSMFAVILLISMLTGCQKLLQTDDYTISATNQSAVTDGLNQQAYRLDDSFVHKMSSSLLTNGDQLTIALWVKPEANFNWTTLFSLGLDETHFMQLSTRGNPDNQQSGLNLAINNGQTTQRLLSNQAATLVLNEYNYIVLTMDKKNYNLYLNGELISGGTLDYSIRDLACNELYIGRSPFFTDPLLQGSFQGLQISNFILSSDTIKAAYSETYPEIILDSIVFQGTDDLRTDVVIPEDLPLSVTWYSSDETLLSSDGKLNTLKTVKQDTEVILTADINENGQNYQRTFSFWVRADTDERRLLRTKEYLINEMGYLFNDQQQLPVRVSNYHTDISWSVISGAALIAGNQLIKNTDNEKESITLQAVIKSGEHLLTVTFEGVLLDEYAGYIMSYFNGEYEHEVGQLAYSYDGLHWTKLSTEQAILTSDLGTQRVRDPFIGRDKAGNFIILATQGWDEPAIFVWFSEDLITFSDHHLLLITQHDDSLDLTGDRAWAPEMTYDPITDQYLIYFSDPRGADTGCLYYVTTQDFMTVSYDQILLTTDYPIIDGTLQVIDGQYWMFFKDNYAQSVYMASSYQLLSGSWEVFDDEFISLKRYIEGPFLIELPDNEYYLYVDSYKKQEFYVAKITQLGDNSDFSWLDADHYQLPKDDVRHGSVIAVTQKELDRIIAADGE
ncbi:MAG: LamG-like jellyroll fold domain-containing protein [Erysipelotrichaceae bacterium]|nr:LamG-like jellyroll fold domain-containing protein [Erysipelotrichaceae bacterium]